MISDKEIGEFADYGAIVSGIHEREVYEFARAIYNLAQQHQRESDAALCRDAAEKYLERSKNCKTNTAEMAALTSNAVAACLETAIRNNKEN